jgi:hypothetical protein
LTAHKKLDAFSHQSDSPYLSVRSVILGGACEYDDSGGKVETENTKKKPKKKRDRVGEAARETFPASDPPSYWASAPTSKKSGQEEASSDNDQDDESSESS